MYISTNLLLTFIATLALSSGQALTTNSFSGGTTQSMVDTGDVTSHMTTISSTSMSGSMTTTTPSTYTAATAGVTSTSNGVAVTPTATAAAAWRVEVGAGLMGLVGGVVAAVL
ncbi:hypothetical protein MMC18_008659 [Xylographa bjoerkii]|nr:hypothetical protein [Xylographa bjoerkii]